MNAYIKTFQQHKDKTPVFIMHAGSANHGCEAIAASLLDLWDESRGAGDRRDGSECHRGASGVAVAGNEQVTFRTVPSVTCSPILVTSSVAEDLRYSLGKRVENRQLVLIEERHMDRHFFSHVAYYVWRKLTGDRESFLRFRFQPLFRYLKMMRLAPEDVILYEIGGDNYCYPEMVEDLILANRVFHKKGYETILVGCSIEPDSIPSHLRFYSHIIARESLTYDALKAAGVPEERLTLTRDPAFTLATDATASLPEGFIPRRTIGINLSPMAQGLEKTSGVTMESYKTLIRHIIESSNAQVALIPHVVWATNDDRVPLQELYEHFADTGRVVMIGDHSAKELKHIISQCSLFIGARTHATIAAYSSAVPTLVLGYSVKSRGIARDLFKGTSVEQMTPHLPAPFVLPVQQLQNPQELINAYDTLLKHAGEVQAVLTSANSHR